MRIVKTIGNIDFWESNGKYDYVHNTSCMLSKPGSKSHQGWVEMTGKDSLDECVNHMNDELYSYVKKKYVEETL
jgi:hypothetical protein